MHYDEYRMNINPYEPPTKPVSVERPPLVASHFSRLHLYVFLAIWCGFTIWTFLIVNSGLDSGSGKSATVFRTTVATILGPMTGAISRDLQGCCLRFSLSLLPYCAASAGIGVLAQVLPLPFERFARAVRILLWTVGWIGWFMGGIVSFMHALLSARTVQYRIPHG